MARPKNEKQTTTNNVTTEEVKVTEIVKAESTNIVTWSDEAEDIIEKAGDGRETFSRAYARQLSRVKSPAHEEFEACIREMPEELQKGFQELFLKMSPDREGLYTTSTQIDRLDLRLDQGTGNDPNKPEDNPPGHFYYSSKEKVGSSFLGTLLIMWQGRTMWPDRDSGGVSAVCTSMDRKVGSAHGDCSVCPMRPWNNNQPTACKDEVIAWFLTKDLKDIVQVKFWKTSEPGGRRLLRLARRNMFPWSKWYKLVTEKKTDPNDNTRRWFVIAPDQLDESVPEGVQKFCRLLSRYIDANFVLPQMAEIYRAANVDSSKQLEATVEAKLATNDPNYTFENSLPAEETNV